MYIRNPVEWSLDQVRSAGSVLGRTAAHRHEAAVPRIRRLSLADIRYALARGIDDFAAFRSARSMNFAPETGCLTVPTAAEGALTDCIRR